MPFAQGVAFPFLLAAQTPKSTPKDKPKPPVLSDSIKESFWKAQSRFNDASKAAQDANQKAQQAQAILQGVIDTMKTECGKDFMPGMVGDDAGCVVPPEPAKTAAPKEEKKP